MRARRCWPAAHSLIPAMKLRLAAPVALVDIGHIEALKGITANGALSIGALTTFAEIASSDLVKQHAPVLAEATGVVGDPAVRNRGTIGGNVSHGDPASDPPTALTALGATYNVSGPGGERSIAASDFATGLLENVLEENEILTQRVGSLPSFRRRFGLRQVPPSRLSLRRRWGRGNRRCPGGKLLIGKRGDWWRRDNADQGVVRGGGAGWV